MTIREWLNKVASTNQSTGDDDTQMQTLLRRAGFPKAVVTCGIVYTEGAGQPVDIHSTAKAILNAQGCK